MSDGQTETHVRLSKSAYVLVGQFDAVMQVPLLFVRFAKSGPRVDYEGQILTHLSVVGSYKVGQLETQL